MNQKLKTFKHYLTAQGKSKSTVTHYHTYILDFISWLDADETEAENATAKEVLSYLNHLQNPIHQGGKGQENKTRAIRLNVINHFFDYQIEQHHRIDHPTKHLKIRGTQHKKLYPILSKQDLDKIYVSYPIPSTPTHNHKTAKLPNWFIQHQLSKQRNKAILSLMVNQGLTTPEINRLKQEDLKLKEGVIYIVGSRKSNERTLALKPNQIMALMDYSYQVRNKLLAYQEDKNTKRLFLSLPVAGQKKSNKETLSIWKGLSKEVKKQHRNFINFKQVRTSVITHWLKEYNLREVQYMAGHRYVSSTEGYLINQTEDLKADIDKYHPFG